MILEDRQLLKDAFKKHATFFDIPEISKKISFVQNKQKVSS